MDPRLRDLALVGHRGYPSAFPENTLLGHQQAVVHGARYVETDVQCTRDGVPVLYHDPVTGRLSGVGGRIYERTLEEIGELDASVPERFGARFQGTPIPTLKAFAGWLAQHPAVTAFIEIKIQSLKVFGVEPVVQQVMEAITEVAERCVVISFNDRCIEHVASSRRVRTGWVLPRWNPRAESRARELSPDYLFAEDVQIPDDPAGIWRGPWQWAVYVIDDLARAMTCVEKGIHFVETDAIGEMMDQYGAGGPAETD